MFLLYKVLSQKFDIPLIVKFKIIDEKILTVFILKYTSWKSNESPWSSDFLIEFYVKRNKRFIA